MRIRDKFLGILGIGFLSAGLVVGMSLFSMAELDRYQTTAERGAEVITRSRGMFGLLKDLSISAFAPDTYGRLKDVFYFEKFETTLRNWEDSVEAFHHAFEVFMTDPALRGLVKTDSVVGDEVFTASTMSNKAFGRLNSVKEGFHALATSGILDQENYYLRIVTSDDPRISGLFSEVRSTSYYLKNNFESFMNHFVNAVQDQLNQTQNTLTWLFLGLTLSSMAASLFFSFLIGAQIVRDVSSLKSGMSGISRGDFSHHITINAQDELGDLARDINHLAAELKSNIDRLLHVTRDVGAGIDARVDLEVIRRIIVETAGRETEASGVALMPRAGSVAGASPALRTGVLENSDAMETLTALVTGQPGFLSAAPADSPFSSVISCSLPAATGEQGILAAVTSTGDRPFTDLDFTLLRSYAEFAALSIDNYLKYRELIELREAELQSLQARIQPHFLYNVMNGLIGLNRMGARTSLENAVLGLKDLLRYTLEHEPTVTLAKELDFVAKYLDLQKLRFGDRFEYAVRCDESAGSLSIPKLLIQPLAENALLHGLEPLVGKGTLTIAAQGAAGDDVELVIEDNGVGFDTATRDAVNGIGLANVRKRMELAYPGSTFSIDSAPGQGCRVRVRLRRQGVPR